LAQDELNVTKFAGQYVFEYYAGYTINVFEENRRLWLQQDGAEAVQLSAESDSEFGSISSGAQIRFLRGPDKRVNGLVVNKEGIEALFRRMHERRRATSDRPREAASRGR
jgi:hypothetical protein